MRRVKRVLGLGLGTSLVVALAALTASSAVEAAAAAGAKAAGPPTKTSFKRAKVTVTRSSIAGSAMKDVVTDRAGYAQYIFSSDKPKARRKSRCYGQCARDWPPLITKLKPKALGDAKQRLLGVTKRRDGSKQVTYRNRPLYYYAHEPDPVFVGCHDVFLNGGNWYAIKTSGKRLP